MGDGVSANFLCTRPLWTVFPQPLGCVAHHPCAWPWHTVPHEMCSPSSMYTTMLHNTYMGYVVYVPNYLCTRPWLTVFHRVCTTSMMYMTMCNVPQWGVYPTNHVHRPGGVCPMACVPYHTCMYISLVCTLGTICPGVFTALPHILCTAPRVLYDMVFSLSLHLIKVHTTLSTVSPWVCLFITLQSPPCP